MVMLGLLQMEITVLFGQLEFILIAIIYHIDLLEDQHVGNRKALRILSHICLSSESLLGFKVNDTILPHFTI